VGCSERARLQPSQQVLWPCHSEFGPRLHSEDDEARRDLRDVDAGGYNEAYMKLRGILLVLAIGGLALTVAGQAPNNSPAPAPNQTQPQVLTPPATGQTAMQATSGANGNTSAASSQQSSTPEDDTVTTIRKTVNEVNVVFTVTDKHGRYVKDLNRNDFNFVDDAKPAAEIRDFKSQTDLPLQVGLLVDASNSVRDRFKFEQESAIEFLNQTVRPKYDAAFVVGFDVTPEVTQDFTDNTEMLSRGVRALRPGGGTAMYDALYYACRDKLLKAPRTGAVRRAIVLLSDGEDNQSHVTREEAIDMAQRADAIVYTISTNISGTKGKGDKVLERIADATGGRAFFPFQLRDVSNAFAEIQDELRSQYAVSYKPADFKADGRYRTIEIVALDKKNLHVRSRRGYFAPVQ
jgi:Ca-activated chloride channel homolog